MKKIYEKNTIPNSDWGLIKTNKFKVNKNSNNRAWIIDDFYEDPDAVREYALQQNYWDKNHGGVGWRTRKQFLFDGVKEKIEEEMKATITNWADIYPICGVFQSGFCGDGAPPLVSHIDEQQWAAMVFLTPNAPFETGTKIVANKKSKFFHYSQCEDNLQSIFPQPHTFCDVTLFEDVDVFGNVYNRMVIIDGQSIHSSCGYFGDNISTGRLWQMFFFDANINK